MFIYRWCHFNSSVTFVFLSFTSCFIHFRSKFYSNRSSFEFPIVRGRLGHSPNKNLRGRMGEGPWKDGGRMGEPKRQCRKTLGNSNKILRGRMVEGFTLVGGSFFEGVQNHCKKQSVEGWWKDIFIFLFYLAVEGTSATRGRMVEGKLTD